MRVAAELRAIDLRSRRQFEGEIGAAFNTVWIYQAPSAPLTPPTTIPRQILHVLPCAPIGISRMRQPAEGAGFFRSRMRIPAKFCSFVPHYKLKLVRIAEMLDVSS
jgi:hypothetical protein